MRLSIDEELVLGGLLRFALRMDTASGNERGEALAAAAQSLGLRPTETYEAVSDRASYRDAAVVLRTIHSDLDRLLDRAERELRNDRELRQRIEGMRDARAREPLAHAIEALASARGGPSLYFVDWLRQAWALGPRT